MNSLAILAVAWVAATAHAGCPVSTYAAQKEKSCAREKCRTFKPSPAIEAIKRGVYFEYVSLFAGDMRTWLAVDVDRQEVIYIQRYPIRAQEKLKGAKEPAGTRVAVSTVDRKHVDYARHRGIPAPKLDEVVCAANALWKAGDEETVRFVTDVATGIYLLDGRQARSLGGAGLAAGNARKLEELLDSLKDPGWEWWNVF